MSTAAAGGEEKFLGDPRLEIRLTGCLDFLWILETRLTDPAVPISNTIALTVPSRWIKRLSYDTATPSSVSHFTDIQCCYEDAISGRFCGQWHDAISTSYKYGYETVYERAEDATACSPVHGRACLPSEPAESSGSDDEANDPVLQIVAHRPRTSTPHRQRNSTPPPPPRPRLGRPSDDRAARNQHSARSPPRHRAPHGAHCAYVLHARTMPNAVSAAHVRCSVAASHAPTRRNQLSTT